MQRTTGNQVPHPEQAPQEPSYANGQQFFFPLDEGETLPRADNPMAVRLFSRLGEEATQRLAMEEKLNTELNTDELTNIANRRAFRAELDKWVANADTENEFALMFIDLDKFKQANDTLGHDAGDELLVGVADKLQIGLREGEFLARLGGDEFVALVNPNNAGNDRRDKNLRPEEVIEGLKNRLSDEVRMVGEQIGAPFVGASIGVAYYQPGETASDILRRADEEMYRIKEAKGATR